MKNEFSILAINLNIINFKYILSNIYLKTSNIIMVHISSEAQYIFLHFSTFLHVFIQNYQNILLCNLSVGKLQK